MTKLGCSLVAVLCLISGCIPPPGAYQPAPSSGGQEPAEYGEYRSSGEEHTWLCSAKGRIGTASEDGSWSYSVEQAVGTGTNRDDAYMKALEECNSQINFSSSIASANDQRTDIEDCEVDDCTGPGQP